MKITKILYKASVTSKALVLCSVVLDDCLKLENISLYHNNEKGYYLVMPSKQDVYQSVEKCNKGKDLVFPKKEGKKYEEFFFPLSANFYKDLLLSVEKGYERYKKDGKKCYIP